MATSVASAGEFIVEEWMGSSPGGRIHLKGQRCAQCNVALWPPAARCKACGSSDLAPIELGPDAELYSITVDWTGTFVGHPHLVGQVRFPEGTFVQGFVVGKLDAPPSIGEAVELVPFNVTSNETVLVTYGFQAKKEV